METPQQTPAVDKLCSPQPDGTIPVVELLKIMNPPRWGQALRWSQPTIELGIDCLQHQTSLREGLQSGIFPDYEQSVLVLVPSWWGRAQELELIYTAGSDQWLVNTGGLPHRQVDDSLLSKATAYLQRLGLSITLRDVSVQWA